MPTTIKIVFRGLMILNDQIDAGTGKRFMEIGFLDARTTPGGGNPHTGHMPDESVVHVPRILTMENGILADVFDLRNRRELGIVRNWQLDVTNPLQPEVMLDMSGGGSLNRRELPTETNKRDFRWVTDFEAGDMHARPLTREIDTSNLLLVLKVQRGEFFTKLHSPFLKKKAGAGTETDYGFAAAATGCDITFDTGGAVRLMAGFDTAAKLVKTFAPKPNRDTVFEISNSPPDVFTGKPSPGGQSHFHLYYDKLFIDAPSDQISFRAIGDAPAPDPVLCSVGHMSQRTLPL